MKAPRIISTRAPAVGIAIAVFVGFAAAACNDHGDAIVDSASLQAEGEPTVTAANGQPAVGTAAVDGGLDIYYDLTAFDWYRQGEPLVIDGRPYQPNGIPESGRARVFEPAGEHLGVRYYIVEGTESPYPTVYVPVSPNYWQPFSTPLTPEPDD